MPTTNIMDHIVTGIDYVWAHHTMDDIRNPDGTPSDTPALFQGGDDISVVPIGQDGSTSAWWGYRGTVTYPNATSLLDWLSEQQQSAANTRSYFDHSDFQQRRVNFEHSTRSLYGIGGDHDGPAYITWSPDDEAQFQYMYSRNAFSDLWRNVQAIPEECHADRHLRRVMQYASQTGLETMTRADITNVGHLLQEQQHGGRDHPSFEEIVNAITDTRPGNLGDQLIPGGIEVNNPDGHVSIVHDIHYRDVWRATCYKAFAAIDTGMTHDQITPTMGMSALFLHTMTPIMRHFGRNFTPWTEVGEPSHYAKMHPWNPNSGEDWLEHAYLSAQDRVNHMQRNGQLVFNSDSNSHTDSPQYQHEIGSNNPNRCPATIYFAVPDSLEGTSAPPPIRWNLAGITCVELPESEVVQMMRTVNYELAANGHAGNSEAVVSVVPNQNGVFPGQMVSVPHQHNTATGEDYALIRLALNNPSAAAFVWDPQQMRLVAWRDPNHQGGEEEQN